MEEGQKNFDSVSKALKKEVLKFEVRVKLVWLSSYQLSLLFTADSTCSGVQGEIPEVLGVSHETTTRGVFSLVCMLCPVTPLLCLCHFQLIKLWEEYLPDAQAIA